MVTQYFIEFADPKRTEEREATIAKYGLPKTGVGRKCADNQIRTLWQVTAGLFGAFIEDGQPMNFFISDGSTIQQVPIIGGEIAGLRPKSRLIAVSPLDLTPLQRSRIKALKRASPHHWSGVR